MVQDNSKNNGLGFTMLMGVLIGAAVAVLSTPKTGEELRNEIQHKVKDLPSEFTGLLDEAKSMYHKMQNVLASVTKHTAEEAKLVIAEQKEKINLAIHKANEKINQLLSDNELT